MKMNNSNTKFIYFGGPRQLEKCIVNQININGEMIQRSHITRYLGSYLYSALNFKEHMKKKCKAAMLNLLKIKASRKFLTKEASSKAVIALVTSHLDYANSILVGLPKVSIDQLYTVSAEYSSKIIVGRSKYESSSKCPEELHWLPIECRINFKVIALVFRCIHRLAHSYLKELIILKKPRRHRLRSEDLTRQLEIPRTSRHTFAARLFKVKGPLHCGINNQHMSEK